MATIIREAGNNGRANGHPRRSRRGCLPRNRLSRKESADLVESVLGLIADALARGEPVKISSFGSFSARTKGQRIGRNPKTGEEVPILRATSWYSARPMC